MFAGKIFCWRCTFPPIPSQDRPGAPFSGRFGLAREKESSTNYYRRFPGDYARDTRHLSLEAHGAYNLLLDHLYATEKPIPDIESAFRICQITTRMRTRGPTSGQKVVMDILTNFFILGPNGYTHKRVDEELSYMESRSKAAKQSAAARWNKDANAVPTQSERNAIPDSRLQTPETSKSNTEREQLADWIPLSLWMDYRAMREKAKRPITAGVADVLIGELRKLRDAGEDVSEVLRQAIGGGWFTFKAVRKEKTNGPQESFEERRQRKSAEAISEVRRRAGEVVREVERGLPDSRNIDTPNGGVRRGS